MSNESATIREWIKVGVITGLAASIIYPVMIFVPLPKAVAVVLLCSFGPLLSIACVGLYHLLKIHRAGIKAQIAVVSNIIAGTLVTIMFIVQTAVNFSMEKYLATATDASIKDSLNMIWKVVDKVQLGLDISWDVYIAIGTFFFGMCMMDHPRFGKTFGSVGVLFALLLLAFNLATFPLPPANNGLVDMGPFVGLWYAAVSVQALRSIKWAHEQTAN
ncbi:MAG: hypothetical protein HY088_10220 [Ignavibacteriales bacterium]|nr:hypothetical protein [Ignavibacteriales bacterium]